MRGLIDDAGMFPPEQLSLEAALNRHRVARDSADAWMLGRFVVKSTDLRAIPQGSSAPLHLTVVIDHTVVHDGFVAAGAAQTRSDLIVESIEIPLSRGKGADVASRLGDLATQLIGAGLGDLELFVEPALGSIEDSAYVITAMDDATREQGIKIYGKIRCGGETVPQPARLAAFIAEACDERLPFKATAGLHHPLARRSADGSVQHGYLNVAGAALLRAGETLTDDGLVELLGDTDGSHFQLDADGFSWKAFHASPQDIAHARQTAFRSFGSCSLQEPIGELGAFVDFEHAPS